MAVDNDGNYVRPFLDAVDEDGYIYDYYVKETNVPRDYKESIDGLKVTNTNIKTADVPVTKEWKDGPAIEDVELHLYRMLVPVSQMQGKSYDDLETLAQTYEWKPVGLAYTAKRTDFVDGDGNPKYDEGSEDTASVSYDGTDPEDDHHKHFIDGFNKKLPMYVTLEEPDPADPDKVVSVDYRAVYKLVEDETSDAYRTTYRTVNNGSTVDDANGNGYYLNEGDNPIVTNTVTATNKAYIAAVKQLLGRDWQSNDDFPFILEPYGKGTYKDDGSFDSVDTSAAAKAAVPMPEDDTVRQSASTKYVKKDGTGEPITAEEYERLSDDEKKAYVVSESTTHAKKDMDFVDPNGKLERLARFGAIEYTVNDLVYDTTDRHMQGDFFYLMKEEVPAGAKLLDDSGEETSTTYADAYAQAAQAATSVDDLVDALKGKMFKLGDITYDGTIHKVHVKVRENRTGDLQLQIAYDEETEGDASTGTQFTPVYTNTIGATTEFKGAKVWVDNKTHDNTTELKNKLILHRDWETTTTEGETTTTTQHTEVVSDYHIDWDGNNFTIIGLPKTNEAGAEYTYWLQEVKLSDEYKLPAYSDGEQGFTLEFDSADDAYKTDEAGVIWVKNGVVVDGTNRDGSTAQGIKTTGAITNTLETGIIFVTKWWNDERDKDGIRKNTNATVTLWKKVWDPTLNNGEGGYNDKESEKVTGTIKAQEGATSGDDSMNRDVPTGYQGTQTTPTKDVEGVVETGNSYAWANLPVYETVTYTDPTDGKQKTKLVKIPYVVIESDIDGYVTTYYCSETAVDKPTETTYYPLYKAPGRSAVVNQTGYQSATLDE